MIGPFLAALCLLAGAAAARPAGAEELTVFAAVSTAELMTATVDAFQTENDVEVRLSVAATSTLARQIERGAPAGVFVAANVAWMDWLDQRKLLVAGSRFDLFGNRLALIVPSDGPPTIDLSPTTDLVAHLADGPFGLADPNHVPAGIYGKAALQSLGLWDQVSARITRSPHVRAVVALVSRGEARLGIVYASDAMAFTSVRQAAIFDSRLHPPIVYQAAAVKGGNLAAAQSLLRFLKGDAVRTLIREAGFTPVRE